MADHFFGLNRGVNDSFPVVTVGTSTGATEIEVRVTDAKLSRKDAVILLEAIIEWINMNQAASTGFTL